MADYDYDKYDVATPNEVREDVEAYESTAEEEVEDFEDGGVTSDSTETVLEEDEEVVESGRITEKPDSDTVEFTVVRAFTWHGTEFEIGEHELPQDEYEAMMYDINLRQDRLVLVL